VGGRQVLSERGSVTVEFFLILPLVVLLLVAGLQVVSAARLRIELSGAVREGVRVAATTPDPARAVDAVISALDPDLAARTRVSVTRPATPGQMATVTATSTHVVDFFVLPDLEFEISARASMRTER
jgi:Flp pilus assembly protein TadG